MTDEKIQQQLQKPIGAAMMPLQWFLLFSFIDHAMKQDDMFSSVEDANALSETVKRLHDQVFPPVKDTLTQLEEELMVKPKDIIKPASTIIV